MRRGRPVTISTVCFEVPDPGVDTPGMTKDGNLRKAEAYVEEAAQRGSDLVVFPELFATHHTALAGREAAEPVPEGEIAQWLAETARRHELYAAGCLYELRGDDVYNTLALFDRRGEIVGQYDKVHVPPEEEKTARPGTGYPVFEADFGRVGALVCFDLNFPEAARCLALGGAEIIVWPTMWSQPGGHVTDVMMRARAIENKVWLVSANYAQRGVEPEAVHIGRSAIVDWAGIVLADTGRRDGIATATIDLDESKEVFGWPADLLARRHPETYRGLDEAAA